MVEFDIARLRRYRLRQCLTIRAFARSMGVSPSQVYRWETGQTLPTIRQFCRLLDRLGARAEGFFLRVPDGAPRSDDGAEPDPAPAPANGGPAGHTAP
jgi:transcriptional regulator with XRE-family HTH domain